ncbi:MAG: ATP-binding cassette domain-containing protein [Burkholderiaceae bacterium]|nr:ATP-binding cassette domain-containing protein [Burkholderiaceae bacterium]
MPDIVAASLPRDQSRWLMRAARSPARAMGWACTAPLVAGMLLLVQAWLLSAVLGGVVEAAVPLAHWWPQLCGIAGLMIARALLGWSGDYAGARASEAIKQGLRRALFARLIGQGPVWTRARVSGELADGLLTQVESLDGFFAKYLPALIAATVLPLAFAAALVPFDIVAGLLLVLTAPLIPLFMALVGVRTLAVLRIAFLSSAVLEFFAALGVAGMAVYFGLSFLGFLDLRVSPLTLHTGLFCLMMAPEAYAPLRQFAAHYHDRATARAAVGELSRMFDGLPTDWRGTDGSGSGEPSRRLAQTPVKPGARPGMAVTIKGLTVHVPDRTRAVIESMDLHLLAGERLAVMGPSGSGKTTLLDALARLCPASGEILLDGIPLADWDEEVLRSDLAYIGQRPYLFEGTLAENILLANPQADAAALNAAARAAGVLAFAERLPAGLDTLLGPRGQGISGGEAHRLALARLYLRTPRLIVLDEPTAHLDAATEAAVWDACLAFAGRATLVVATHSSAVAVRCERRLTLASVEGLPS